MIKQPSPEHCPIPGAIKLYPDFTARMWEAFGCAPLIVTGPKLEAARALVAGFAAEVKALPKSTMSVSDIVDLIDARAEPPKKSGEYKERQPRHTRQATAQPLRAPGRRCDAVSSKIVEAADASLTERFHAFEPDEGLRWARGDAALPAAMFAGFEGGMELVPHVACTTRYPLPGVARRQAA